LLGAFTLAPAAAQEKGWVGEFIAPTAPLKELRFWAVVGDEEVRLTFAGDWPFRVRADSDGKLRIHDGRREGWVHKKDFVRLRDSIAYFADRVGTDRSDSWAQFMLGTLHMMKGDADTAIKHLSTCIQVEPKFDMAFNNRGLALTSKKEFDEAIDDFNEVIKLAPKSALGYRNRGVAFSGKNEHDRAIKDFDAALALDPRDGAAYYHRGRAWVDKSDLDRAIKDLDEAIRLDYKTSDAYLSRAFALHDKAAYARAINDYDEVIRMGVKHPLVYSRRGDAHMRSNQYDRAIKDFDEAIRLNPDDAAGYFDRGLAWLLKKDPDRAINDFDEMIRLSPTEPLAFVMRGDAFKTKKQYDRALADLNEAVRLDPARRGSVDSRGQLLHAMQQYDKAIKDFDTAIRLDPKAPTTYAHRGFSFCARGEFDKAVDDFDRALKIDRKDSWAGFNRPLALMLARKPAAAEGFKAFLDLHGWKHRFASYAVIGGHLACRLDGKDAEAGQILKDATAKLSEGWPGPVLKFLAGEIDGAALLASARESGEQTEAHCYLAFDSLLRGKKDDALTHFRWVRQHGDPTYVEFVIALAELRRLKNDGSDRGAGASGTLSPK
jgi:tetratricopeptide (TPR) repeat protein